MKKNRVIGYSCIAVTAVLFSLMEVALKYTSGVFAPLQIVFIRFFVGSIILIPFMLHDQKKRGSGMPWKDLPHYMLTGFLCVPLSMVLFQLGVYYGKASEAAVLFSSNSILTTVFAAVFLKEKLKPRHLIAVGFILTAILIIVQPRKDGDSLGIVMSLTAAAAFALYVVSARPKLKTAGSLTSTCLSLFFGSLETLLILLIGHIPAAAAFFRGAGLEIFAEVPVISPIPASAWPAFLYICVGVSAIGYVTQSLAIEKTSAHEAALVFFIKPALAPLCAMLFLQEELGLTMWIGIGLFLIGSAFSMLPGLTGKKQRA